MYVFRNNFRFTIMFCFVFTGSIISESIDAQTSGTELWSSRIPVSLNGVIVPIESLRVQSSVGGRITDITVKENQMVSRDQVLLTLKNDTQKQQLEVAKLQVEMNQNNLTNSLQQIALSEVQLETARKQLEMSINNIKDKERQVVLTKLQLETSRNNLKDRERQVKLTEAQIEMSRNNLKDQETNLKDILRRLKDEQTLFEQGSSTKSQLDAVQLQKDRAVLAVENSKLTLARTEQEMQGVEIAVENAKIAMTRSEQDINGAVLAVENTKLSVETSKLGVLRAEQDLQRTKITAENSKLTLKLSEQDVITRQDALNDTYVRSKIDGIVVSKMMQVGEVISAGAELFKIINIEKVEIITEVSEADLFGIKIGQLIVFTTPSFPKKQYKGEIDRIAWTSNPETGLFPVVALANNSQSKLRAGMSVKIYIVNP